MPSCRAGFTLIEILVVVAIIGMLASIVFAGLGGVRSRGRIASAQSSLRNFYTGLLLCSDAVVGDAVNLPKSDSQNGGGGPICEDALVTSSAYVSLPNGWMYCDVTATGNCGNDASGYSPLTLIGKGDGKKVTCTEKGCVTTDDSD